MDKNTLVGLLLIGAIVIGFSILNGPSDADLAESKRLRDSIEQVEAVQQEVIEEQAQKMESTFNEVVDTSGKVAQVAISDSASLQQQVQFYGAFAQASVGKAKEFEVETDLMRLTFSTKGGGIKKTVYKYNFDGSINTTFEDLTSAGKSINVRKQAISRACWSVNHTLGGYLWSYDHKEPFIVEPDNRKKQVTQFTLDGVIIAKYSSVSEASRITGLSKTCISRCCRGERKSSSGFLWKYQD